MIRCQDDGAGLNLPAIQRLAIERGLIAPDKSLAEEELIRLILLPGFSTQSQTTQTSGRGIGMDVVYSRLLDMKGTLRIQTKAGQGCLMELRLPVTLISTHALLLRIRNQIYALSDRGIEQILYYGVGTIQTVGNTTTFRLENDIYELTNFAALLNLPPDRREKHRTTPPIILARDERGTIRAVLADEIIDSRDLVVKTWEVICPNSTALSAPPSWVTAAWLPSWICQNCCALAKPSIGLRSPPRKRRPTPTLPSVKSCWRWMTRSARAARSHNLSRTPASRSVRRAMAWKPLKSSTAKYRT